MANWVEKLRVCYPIPCTHIIRNIDAIDLEKSFKPSQQLKSYIEYAKTQESELLKKQKNAMSQFIWFITITCILFTKYKSLLYPCTVLTYLLNGILNKNYIEDS